MPVTRDIAATYRGPRKVMQRLLDMGQREDRALIFVMAACVLIFVAQTPYQAREAYLAPEGPLSVRLYWSAFLWIFIMPLLFYAVAAGIWILSRVARRKISGYAIRLTLFWSILATAPIILLAGLTAGFIGPGLELKIIGLIWLGCFLWFWLAGLWQAERP